MRHTAVRDQFPITRNRGSNPRTSINLASLALAVHHALVGGEHDDRDEGPDEGAPALNRDRQLFGKGKKDERG